MYVSYLLANALSSARLVLVHVGGILAGVEAVVERDAASGLAVVVEHALGDACEEDTIQKRE